MTTFIELMQGLGPLGWSALALVVVGVVSAPLLVRVVADAEGISAETVRGTLKLELGWEMPQLQARQKVIEEIPALVKDLAVAVGLLEQVAKATTCGHDLFWVREVLRRISGDEVAGGVLDGSIEDAKHAAKGAADNVLSYLDGAKRAELVAMLKPWWRPIPNGSFDMGCEQGDDDEKPIHRVTFISGFQMLAVPVTWAMYRLFDPGHDAARSDFGGKLPPEAQDEVPVYNVSWYASVMFAEWVGARLPLEPEWEYACRAGTKTRFWSGDTDEDLARVGWTNDAEWSGNGNAQGHPHPVAQKPQNAWGLHDVHGNVDEWCADVYDGNAYAARADGLTVDPRGLTFAVGKAVPMSADSADRGAPRVLRSGSWHGWPMSARSAYRYSRRPSVTNAGSSASACCCPPPSGHRPPLVAAPSSAHPTAQHPHPASTHVTRRATAQPPRGFSAIHKPVNRQAAPSARPVTAQISAISSFVSAHTLSQRRPRPPSRSSQRRTCIGGG